MDQLKQQLQFKEVELSQKFQEDLHAKERTILELKQEKELQQKEQEVQQTALKRKNTNWNYVRRKTNSS